MTQNWGGWMNSKLLRKQIYNARHKKVETSARGLDNFYWDLKRFSGEDFEQCKPPCTGNPTQCVRIDQKGPWMFYKDSARNTYQACNKNKDGIRREAWWGKIQFILTTPLQKLGNFFLGNIFYARKVASRGLEKRAVTFWESTDTPNSPQFCRNNVVGNFCNNSTDSNNSNPVKSLRC